MYVIAMKAVHMYIHSIYTVYIISTIYIYMYIYYVCIYTDVVAIYKDYVHITL